MAKDIRESRQRQERKAKRLAAACAAGLTSVPVFRVSTLDDALSHLTAERDENTCRKGFTPGEAVALGERLEALERPKAAERQGRPGKKRTEHSGKLPEHKRDTRDLVGRGVGMSGKNYEMAKAVVKAAAWDAAARVVLDHMNQTGNVSKAPAATSEAKPPEPPKPAGEPSGNGGASGPAMACHRWLVSRQIPLRSSVERSPFSPFREP